jgi:hypothetical protein
VENPGGRAVFDAGPERSIVLRLSFFAVCEDNAFRQQYPGVLRDPQSLNTEVAGMLCAGFVKA